MTSQVGVVLASGFGGSARQPLLVKIRRALQAHGILSRSVGFGAARPSPGYGRELAKIAQSVRALEKAGCGEIVLVGRSFGGRICTFWAQSNAPRGLIVLGYPIRPPGRPRPEDERALAAVTCPTWILQGENDALGPLEVLRPLVASNPKLALEVLPGVGHSLGRQTANAIESTVRRILYWKNMGDSQ